MPDQSVGQSKPSEQRKTDSRQADRVPFIIAKALRLLNLHVTCTCAMSRGVHTPDCHINQALKLSVMAEEDGFDLLYRLYERTDRFSIDTKITESAYRRNDATQKRNKR